MEITVPATLANFGPGVASLGLALDFGLTVEVLEASTTWEVQHNLGDRIPHDHTNYLVQIATKLAPDLAPHVLKVTSSIPLAMGLGSSTAALLAGIELANQLGELGLDDYTKLTLAARTEGQPANVVAALLGGATTSYLDEQLELFASGMVMPDYSIVLYQPETDRVNQERPTLVAPAVSAKAATAAAASGNMLMTAWQTQQLALAGRLLENDQLVNPDIIAHSAVAKIRQASHALDLYGTVVVGNGPAVATFLAPDQVSDFLDVVAYLELPGEFSVHQIAPTGLRVTN